MSRDDKNRFTSNPRAHPFINPFINPFEATMNSSLQNLQRTYLRNALAEAKRAQAAANRISIGPSGEVNLLKSAVLGLSCELINVIRVLNTVIDDL